jgi:hypothetical protein
MKTGKTVKEKSSCLPPRHWKIKNSSTILTIYNVAA